MAMDTNDFIVGARVRTADGEELGAVKELVGRYFKVAAPMAPDYWLPQECLKAASDSELLLTITRDEVSGYEVPSGEIEAERAAGGAPRDEQDMAVEAAAIVWGPDEWAVVRSRIREAVRSRSINVMDRVSAWAIASCRPSGERAIPTVRMSLTGGPAPSGWCRPRGRSASRG